MVQPHVANNDCATGKIMLDPLDGEAIDQNFEAVLFGDCTGNWQPPTVGAEIMPGRNAPRVELSQLAQRRGTLTARLYVRSSRPFQALGARLSYDGSALELLGATAKGAPGALVVAAEHGPGDGQIALASADPVGGRRGAVVQLIFRLRAGAVDSGSVTLVEASVDDQPARVGK
jgi:hypothetical protein